MRSFLVAAGFVVLAGAAQAGVIERACLSSERANGNRQLCGCIQAAADVTLSASDQRTAARFFKDPEKAQEMRVATNRTRDEFWEKYKNFGAMAEAYCAAG